MNPTKTTDESIRCFCFCGLISAWTRRSFPSSNHKASLSSAQPHNQKIVRIKIVVSCAEMLYSVIAIINLQKERTMTDSVYKVIELVGTSTESWEKAATVAVERAAQSLRELRVAEVVELDMVIDEGKVTAYRAKLKVSFKYESGE